MGDGDREELIAENERELAGFASGASTAITPALERVLEEIRTTGVPCYSWAHLKKLLSAKLQLAMDQVAAADTSGAAVGIGWSPTHKNRVDERRSNITELLNTFEGPPFTLQRLTEVILEPTKSYKTLSKLINALEKLLAVSTTIQVADPRAPRDMSPPSVAAESDILQAPLAVQISPGSTDFDAAARAPWSNAEVSS